MPTFAIRLESEMIQAMFGAAELNSDKVFEGLQYLVVTPIGFTEFNVKLMTEDEIVKAVQQNPELEIMG